MSLGLSRREILTGVLAMPLISGMMVTTPVDGMSSGDSGATVPVPARNFGAAVRPDQLSSENALCDAIRGCQILVPEYHGQWSAVEWRRGDPWYGNYDAICDFAERNGQIVRGHSLIWEKMTPDWARDEMAERRDWRTIERHFATLVPRYRGRISEWVVVNEMIDTQDGDHGLRRTSFQRAYGNDYVRRALETARALDPSAKLMINDYSLVYDNPIDEARRNRMLRLVEDLKARNVPLDMVGIQGHLELAKGKVDQRRTARFLKDLAAMDVEIAITELDVLESDMSLPIPNRDARVASTVHDLLDVALDQPAVRSVVTWGLSDQDSWLQDRARSTREAQTCSPVDCHRLNRGLPFDGEMKPKPMQIALSRVRALA